MSAGDSNSPVTDFTSLDYASIRTDLETFAQKVFTGEQWTDFNASNSATGFLELLSYLTDMLAYGINASTQEAMVLNAVREQNFRIAAKALAFTMKGASPSAGTIRIAGLSDVSTRYPLTLRTTTKFATDSGIVFQPDADQTWTWPPSYDAQLGYYVTLDVTNGDLHTDTPGNSSGTANQRFVLSTIAVLEDTISVVVGSSAYTAIQNAVEAGPNDRVYLVDTNDAGVTAITFGDNINGTIPPLGQQVRITYKTGGGTETNFPIGTTLTLTQGDPLGVEDQAITTGSPIIQFTVAATEGGPRQSLVNAKRALPLVSMTNDRAVTEDDHAALAMQVVGVFKARGVSGKPMGGGTPLLLFIVPTGMGTTISAALRNRIMVALRPRRMANKRILISGPPYVRFLFEIEAHCVSTVKKALVVSGLKALHTYLFSADNAEFGVGFNLQPLYELVSQARITGLSHVLYRKATIAPHSGRYTMTSITGNGDAEGILVDWSKVGRREWRILVLPPDPVSGIYVTRFVVRQRHLGTVASATDSVITDERANYQGQVLAGWFFHPRPEELGDDFQWPITANTTQTFTVSGSSLLASVEPGDSYTIEKDQAPANFGKILRTLVAVNAAISTFIYVGDVDDEWQSLQVNDKVLIRSNGVEDQRRTVTGIVPRTQLLVDWDMEASTTSAWTAIASATLFKTPTSQSGSYGLRITYNGVAGPGAGQSVLTVGQRYVLHGYARGDGTRVPHVRTEDGTIIWQGVSDAVWQEIPTTEFVANGTSLILGFAGGVAGALVIFDNVTCYTKPGIYLDTSVTTVANATVDTYWTSDDGVVSFAVVDGTTPFAAGDTLYVDTYPAVGDIVIRESDFPVLDSADVSVLTVGGI